jgi:SpoVK/Ycf46/Vps4 family AAA+-type ATPase
LKKTETKFILDLIHAGFAGEPRKTELAALSLARSFKKEYPEISASIFSAVGQFSLTGHSVARGIGNSPVPIDNDSQLEMASIVTPDGNQNQLPILNSDIIDQVSSFIEERSKVDVLLKMNLKPTTSMLLIGPPGTGKTMLAKHIATALDKNLVILDLASSVSSMMGKTGANIKKVIQYAKQNACVLLFDEFDAIAKKRDDNNDLGEIKRVVNILLMELEDWPISSLFIATSNHPELLDRAIWRRFDQVIMLPLPEYEQRLAILHNELNDFLAATETSTEILKPVAKIFGGKNASDISKYANRVKRRSVLKEEKPVISIFKEIPEIDNDKKFRGEFCVIAKDIMGDKLTVRELAEITGLSPTGVQHHLTRAKHE